MKASGCKIYYSLAFICYLEAVLWTTLLLSGCVAISAGPEGSAYLHRETVNQGRADFNLHPTQIGSDVNRLVLKAFDLHQQLESLSIQKLATSSLRPLNIDKEGLCGNSYLSLAQALKGVPAPFAGISVVL